VKKLSSEDIVDLEVKDPDDKPSGKLRRKHRQWGGASLGLLAGMAGLLGGRLGYLYPAFDVIAQFGMQFTLMVIGFALAIFMPRFKAIFGFAFTAALIAGYGAWPHLNAADLPRGPFPVTAGEVVFRVAQFNVFAENADNAAIAKEVERLDADVVTLVEFDRSKGPILQLLARQYPFTHAYYDEDYRNFAVLSKFPIEAIQGRAIWEGPPYAGALLGGKLGGLWVYAIHTTRFPYSRAQLNQFKGLVKKLESRAGPTLMMGDFNTTPFSRLPGLIEDGLGLRRVTHLPTWPARLGLPQLAIDHIFISDELRVVAEQQIGNNAGSDHYPITMTLAFKPR
jgi:endonuclease/exonuclease/phosphatase (EEP) superfamily protein YafD